MNDFPTVKGLHIFGFFRTFNVQQNVTRQKHVMRKNDDNKHVLFSNDGEYIWVESCVPSLG